MKTFFLCIFMLAFIVLCSADSPVEVSQDRLNKFKSPGSELPNLENTLNPFDSKGKTIYDGLNRFYQNNHSPNSVEALTDQIIFVSDRWDAKRSQTNRLIPFTDEIIESIMADPDKSMKAILQFSVLNSYVKTDLITSLQELIVKRQEEFSISYNFITGFKSEILNDSVFTAKETETILTVASISRYSLYSAAERKDKDWDILVGNKPAKAFFGENEAAFFLLLPYLLS